jgi:short-subunit dehydrogenase
VVNVGTAATPWAALSSASKAAVHALRLELRPMGVHVVKVVPRAVRSGLGHANLEAMARQPRWRVYSGFAAAIQERARRIRVGHRIFFAFFLKK